MALQLSFSISDKTTIIQLKGILNEYSSVLDTVEINPDYDLHIDLKELKSMNSLGIRNFYDWIHKVKCQHLVLFHCPRVFVAQMNMVDGFLPEKTEVESFFVPFYSEEKGEDTEVLFTKYLEYKKENGNLKLSLPVVYDSDGNRMELDVMENQYFRFLEKYY